MAQKNDPSLFIGLAVSFGSVLIGYMLEGGSPGTLLGVSPAIIVFGGTLGTLIVGFSLKEVLAMGKYLGESMKSPLHPDKELGEKIVAMAEQARREGLLSLEDSVEDIEDPYFRKGIRMVIDGVDGEEVNKILDTEMTIFEHHEKEKAEIFFQMGGFLPTLGILGTVTGLVLVLSHLGGDAEHLGHSIAVAFIATLYGVGFANLFALPLSNKIKLNMKVTKLRMEMIMTGVLSLQQGDNPGLLEEKLRVYLPDPTVSLRGEGNS